VRKLERAGFSRIKVLDERPYAIDDLEGYPLFTPSLIANLRRLLPAERHANVARSVVFTAVK
jgi:hypothetical protein